MSQKEIHSLPDEEIIISMLRPFLPLFKWKMNPYNLKWNLLQPGKKRPSQMIMKYYIPSYQNGEISLWKQRS